MSITTRSLFVISGAALLAIASIAGAGAVDQDSQLSPAGSNCLDNFDVYGHSIANIGDLDGDGLPEIVTGAVRDDDGGRDFGAAYLTFLNADGSVKQVQKFSDSEGFLSGPGDPGGLLETFDRFASQLAGIGDFDGNGVRDIVIGANRDNDGGTSRGSVYILFLNDRNLVESRQKISDLEGFFSGPGNPGDFLNNADLLGSAIADIGDLDGDTIGDLAVSAHRDDTYTDGIDQGENRGAIYILFLNPDGTVKSKQEISDAAGQLTGETNPGGLIDEKDRFGRALAPLGDLDGDGVMDLAAGTQRDDDGGINFGAVYVLFLNADGTVKSHQKISETAGGFTGPGDPGGLLGLNDRLGRAVANVGDLNLDGVTDIAVGSVRDDDGVVDAGAVYIMFLNTNGTVKAVQKVSNTAGNLTGAGNPGGLLDEGDFFGRALAGLGDLDGDNVPDLAVGAVHDDDGGTDRGAVYILFLNMDGTVKSHAKISDIEGGLSCS